MSLIQMTIQANPYNNTYRPVGFSSHFDKNAAQFTCFPIQIVRPLQTNPRKPQALQRIDDSETDDQAQTAQPAHRTISTPTDGHENISSER